MFPVPGGKILAHEQVQLEMDMGAVLANALARIAGASHGGDDFARLDGLAGLQTVAHLAQMRVKRINFHAFHDVFHHNVIAVIRKPGFAIDVGHGAIGRDHDRIDGFAAFVVLDRTDIETFVQLAAVGTNTTERAAAPNLAWCGREEFYLAVGFVKGAIGGGQLEQFGPQRNAAEQQRHEITSHPAHFTRSYLVLRRSLSAKLLMPRTIRSASSRVASGVKVKTPVVMRVERRGAASQRSSLE